MGRKYFENFGKKTIAPAPKVQKTSQNKIIGAILKHTEKKKEKKKKKSKIHRKAVINFWCNLTVEKKNGKDKDMKNREGGSYNL